MEGAYDLLVQALSISDSNALGRNLPLRGSCRSFDVHGIRVGDNISAPLRHHATMTGHA